MKIYGLGMLFFVLLLIGCKKENSFVRQEQRDGYTVTSFSIPGAQPEQGSMKLTEVMENARIVPLETTDDCLISWGAKYYIGSSYILVFQEEYIALFDRGGHFERIVARQGRGPGEYVNYVDFCVDEKNELLFVLETYPKGRLKSYHLQDSTYFKQIEPIESRGLNAVEILDNGDFLLAFNPSKDVKYLYCQQTPAGELRDNVSCHSTQDGFFTAKRLVQKVGESYRYYSIGDMFSDDTVFNISSNGLQPRWIFDFNATKKYRVMGETPGYLFFDFNLVVKKETEELGDAARCVGIEFETQHFCYHKKNGHLMQIDDFSDDYFSGRDWSFEQAHIQGGRILYIVASAMDLSEVVGKNPVPTKYADRWEKVIGNWNENNNPVLLIGELK